MKKLFSLVVLCALLAAVISEPALGRGRKKYTPAPTIKAPVIASVGPSSITITEQSGTKTYTITQFTEISVNGQRATVADLKPGMTVNVTLGTDASKASRINASGAPK
jgi:hypothetical protein